MGDDQNIKNFLRGSFSCKGRGLCPSCGTKRASLFSELLQSRILADVPHAQWVFTLPKMLRPYFLFHRELLAELARLTYETVRALMAAAADQPQAGSTLNPVSESRPSDWSEEEAIGRVQLRI